MDASPPHVGKLGRDKKIKTISPAKAEAMKAVEDAAEQGLKPVVSDPPKNLEEEG